MVFGENILNYVFGWLVKWNPLGALIIITLLMTLIVTLIYKYATNQRVMREIKEELKEIQKKIKADKDDPHKVLEHNKLVMEKQMIMFKQSFKPMLITLLPILLLFGWLRATYDPYGKLFIGLSWLWTYIIFSMIFSLTLRKLLKVN